MARAGKKRRLVLSSDSENGSEDEQCGEASTRSAAVKIDQHASTDEMNTNVAELTSKNVDDVMCAAMALDDDDEQTELAARPARRPLWKRLRAYSSDDDEQNECDFAIPMDVSSTDEKTIIEISSDEDEKTIVTSVGLRA